MSAGVVKRLKSKPVLVDTLRDPDRYKISWIEPEALRATVCRFITHSFVCPRRTRRFFVKSYRCSFFSLLFLIRGRGRRQSRYEKTTDYHTSVSRKWYFCHLRFRRIPYFSQRHAYRHVSRQTRGRRTAPSTRPLLSECYYRSLHTSISRVFWSFIFTHLQIVRKQKKKIIIITKHAHRTDLIRYIMFN